MARFFIDRPIFAWVIAIILMLAGILALRGLPVERYPDIAPPQVSISASYPGASAQVVENSVTQIIEQANKHANSIIEQAKEQARAEGERLIAGARAEIEQEVNRAKDQLRNQVAALAVAGAEKILESQVDAKVHNDLVEKLASQL